MRGEFVDWFGRRSPRRPRSRRGAERYNFFANRFRAGVRVLLPPVELNFQLQDTELANLPENASLPPPVGNLGTGAIYFANTRRSPQGEPVLKQGTLTVRGRGVHRDVRALRVPRRARGRARPTRRSRSLARRASPSAWSVRSTSPTSAGASTACAWPTTSPTGTSPRSARRPTQGGFEISANRELDIELAGLALTLKRLPQAPPLERAPLLPLLSRRAATTRSRWTTGRFRRAWPTHDPITINTIGANAITAIDAAPASSTGCSGAPCRRGRGDAESHSAWACAVEGGYQLPRVPASPWLRAGWNRSSGDNDPNDGQHGRSSS